ncbi:type II toxin-antitoxin system PemK/MazF family toxin [Agrobacterium vitis]
MTETQEREWPKRFTVTIRASPRVGNLYWCAFHDERHIHIPEMWKMRPVLVVSRKNTLRGKVTVLPFSTSDRNDGSEFAYEASAATRKLIDNKDRTWVLCDHPVTIATSRLSQIKGGVPHMPGAELATVLTFMLKSLAAPMV